MCSPYHARRDIVSSNCRVEKNVYLCENIQHRIMRPIFLVGFMGSGKTTLGRTLSAKMNLQFIDLDIFIENRFCRSVKQIFAESGEAAFRKIERNILLEV